MRTVLQLGHAQRRRLRNTPRILLGGGVLAAALLLLAASPPLEHGLESQDQSGGEPRVAKRPPDSGREHGEQGIKPLSELPLGRPVDLLRTDEPPWVYTPELQGDLLAVVESTEWTAVQEKITTIGIAARVHCGAGSETPLAQSLPCTGSMA